jgi:hypothetical protein
MPTSKTVTANRLKSKKATGPIPIEAHAGFRFNARLRAIHQDPAELTAEYREHYNPSGFHEHFLVDSLVHKESRLRQLRAVEAGIWEQATTIFQQETPAAAATTRALVRIQRLLDSYQDNYHRTLKELYRLRASQTKPSKAASVKLVPFRQKPQTPPDAA